MGSKDLPKMKKNICRLAHKNRHMEVVPLLCRPHSSSLALNWPKLSLSIIPMFPFALSASYTGILQNPPKKNKERITKTQFEQQKQLLTALNYDPFSFTIKEAENKKSPFQLFRLLGLQWLVQF